MKASTLARIELVNRKMLKVKLLERRLESATDDLEKAVDICRDDINEYVQNLFLSTCGDMRKVAEAMLKDGVPYEYIERITGLKRLHLYKLKQILGLTKKGSGK